MPWEGKAHSANGRVEIREAIMAEEVDRVARGMSEMRMTAASVKQRRMGRGEKEKEMGGMRRKEMKGWKGN